MGPHIVAIRANVHKAHGCDDGDKVLATAVASRRTSPGIAGKTGKRRMKRLLMTGAAGGIGRRVRKRLTEFCEILRVSDIEPLEPAGEREEVVQCDLCDRDRVRELVRDCDGILHLGGKSIEGSFEVILNANIIGCYNLFEAARNTGKPRILYASSNHAIGYYPRDARLDATATLRPDSLYGVSKCFGEALASLYHDKFGIETAIVRIGSCFPEPRNHRMLATWLSTDDFLALVERVFRVPRLGCPIIYGASDNDESWWDNRHVRYLGWKPKDNAESFRSKLDSAAGPPEDSAELRYQGGAFAQAGHFEDE